MTPLETERERLRQLRGYYGHLKRADMRTRTQLGETYLGERKRVRLEPLLKETERDIQEAERRICEMVKDAGTARRNGSAKGSRRTRALVGGTPAGGDAGGKGRR